MSMTDQIALFGNGGFLADYLRTRQQSALGLVEQLSPQQLQGGSAEALAQHIVEQMSIEPLALDLSKMERQQTSTSISKELEASDYGMPAWRQAMVRGHVMHYIIPFSGEPTLWQLSNGPRSEYTGAVNAELLTLTLTLQNTTDVDSHWYQRQMEQTMRRLDVLISDQAMELRKHHAQLAHAVQSAVARRQLHARV